MQSTGGFNQKEKHLTELAIGNCDLSGLKEVAGEKNAENISITKYISNG